MEYANRNCLVLAQAIWGEMHWKNLAIYISKNVNIWKAIEAIMQVFIKFNDTT